MVEVGAGAALAVRVARPSTHDARLDRSRRPGKGSRGLTGLTTREGVGGKMKKNVCVVNITCCWCRD